MLTWASLSVTSFAADSFNPDDMGTPTFVYGNVVPAYTAVNSAGYAVGKTQNGTFTNDGIFANGWYHKQTNTGGNTYDNNYHQYTFDTSSVFGDKYTIKGGDTIYLSFYYKSASSFDFNGTNYVGKDSPATINIKIGGNNKNGFAMYNLNKYEANSKNRFTPLTFAKADDQWHKLQYFVHITDAHFNTGTNAGKYVATEGKLIVTFDFQTTAEAYDIRFADFTIGKMNFDSTKTYTDNMGARAAEYLPRVIENTKANVKYLSTDGYI